MKIIHTPSSILTTPASPVTIYDKKLESLIVDMKQALIEQKDPEGVGLAAPQVGVAKRLFIIKPSKKDHITVCVNPTVIRISKALAGKETKEKVHLEGCLSIPRLWGHVDRQLEIELAWEDETGKKYQKTFSGFEATIIQHELDHLEGILFTQRVFEQGYQLYKETKDGLEEYEIG